MTLRDFLVEKFKHGISYEDAAPFCIAIYSRAELLPAFAPANPLSMEDIAVAFAEFAELELITEYSPYKAVPYGANYHSVGDKGHWIEVMASVFKLKTTIDMNRVSVLLDSIKN